MTSTATPKRPAAAKKPQDHQPKTVKPKVTAVDGGREINLRGFTVTVPDAAFDDFELLDDLRAVQAEQDVSRMPGLLRRLVGEDGFRTAMEGLRDKETGRVKVEDALAYVGEVFEAVSPNS